MKKSGFNVPDFDFIPDYTEFLLNDEDININYPPEIIKNYITEKIKNFNLSDGLSVRSASFDEDNSNQSSAGRYLSFNGLSDMNEIIKAAFIIWKHHRLNSSKTKCPLILQETHPSFYSGVAFKDGENIVIESYYGACCNIVNGTIKPYTTIIKSGEIIHKYNSKNNYTYRFSVHKNIFKNKIFEYGKILTPVLSSYTTNNRLYEIENSKIINVYGNRPPTPVENYEKKIIPQLLTIISKLNNEEGVDIEWGTDKDANVYMYQFRKLTRKIVDVNILNKEYVPGTGEIIGIPVSSGIAEGIITKNIENLSKNSVLYIENDNIEDIGLLKNIKGIISVNGGILSHLSIICRELNIPCIVGIEKPIPDGSKVELDADTGLIRIIN